MRKVRPSFVVEYKGGRRQKRSQDKSIWGTIDFASLAAEDDLAPQATIKPVTTVGDHQRTDHDVPDGHLVDPKIAVDPRPSLRAATSSPKANQEAGSAASPARGAQSLREEMISARDDNHFHEQSADVEWVPDDIQQGSVVAPDDRATWVLPDTLLSRRQLAELDAENVELKRLLKNRLLAENQCLVTMLERLSR